MTENAKEVTGFINDFRVTANGKTILQGISLIVIAIGTIMFGTVSKLEPTTIDKEEK